MEFITFTALYLGLTAALVFIMLFGESPLFTDTPIASLHWLITQGVCSGGEWVASCRVTLPHAAAAPSTPRARCQRSRRADREPPGARRWLVSKLCGQRGVRAVDSALECCCERSNPTLQVGRRLGQLEGPPLARAPPASSPRAAATPARRARPTRRLPHLPRARAAPQVAYLLIVATGYYLFWSSLFTRLPTKTVGEEHM
jgi:hypothetical protein